MIQIKSYAKINLSLDVGEVMPSGMHPVDMIMQQTSLADDVMISLRENAESENSSVREANHTGDTPNKAIEIPDGFRVLLSTNSTEIPTDRGNIAFRAAETIAKKYCEVKPEKAKGDSKKTIRIYIDKQIPIAAGLAGGSGNAAAVLHGLNALWDLGLSLDDLCELGSNLGSDVPFCILGQATKNIYLPHHIQGDKRALSCARARGTGTDLNFVAPLRAHLIIAKPRIGVSTAEVYRGIDSCEIKARPNNDTLEEALTCQSIKNAVPEMINVLENYTLKAYPEVQALKTFMQEKLNAIHVLMSGSGPSVFAIFDDEMEAIEAFKKFREFKDSVYDVVLCKTI